MKTHILSITLDIFTGNIQDAISDAQEIIDFTGVNEVKFVWNDTPVKVHPGDNPEDIVRKYYKDRVR